MEKFLTIWEHLSHSDPPLQNPGYFLAVHQGVYAAFQGC